MVAQPTDDPTGQPPALGALAEQLTGLGLDPEAARLYVHLLSLGASRVSDLAETAGLNRSKAYRTLDDLEARGFVSASLERPTRYTAEPADDVFRALIEAQRTRVQELEAAREEILPKLEAVSRQGPDGLFQPPRFQVLQGRPSIYRTVQRMLKEAEDTLLSISTHEAAIQLGRLAGLRETGIEQVEGGLRIRSILKDTPENREQSKIAGFEAAEQRLLDTERTIRFLIVDGKEMVLFVVSDPSARLKAAEDVAIWTDAQHFIETQQALFEIVWEQAQKV